MSDHSSDVSDPLISVDDLDSEEEDGISDTKYRSSPLSGMQDEDTSSSSTYSGKIGNSLSPGGLAARLKKKSSLSNKCLDEKELQNLRLKINSRERRRMHDLNSALDGLREVMPYAHGPSVRKLSKIATLLLARNYILMLNSSLEEMKKLVSDIYQTHPPPARTGSGSHHVHHLHGSMAPSPTSSAASLVSGGNVHGLPTSISSGDRAEPPHHHVQPHLTAHLQTPTTLSLASLHGPSQYSPCEVSPVETPGKITTTTAGMAFTRLTSALPAAQHHSVPNLQHHHSHEQRAALVYGRWQPPCACNHCLVDSVRSSYGAHIARFPYHLVTTQTPPLQK